LSRKRVGDRARTGDILIHSQPEEDIDGRKNQGLRVYPERVTDRVTGIASDPDLDALLAAWPSLPPHVKATILSLVGLLPRML